MHQWIEFALSNHFLAIAVPSVIFFVTLFLVVRQLISFLFTLAFLAFAICAGVAIANYDVVREYLKENHRELSQIESQLSEFHSDLVHTFQDLQADMKDQRQAVRKVVNTARDLLDEMDEHAASFRDFVEHNVVPTLEKAFSDDGSVGESPKAEEKGVVETE